jgi:hypothetical protein
VAAHGLIGAIAERTKEAKLQTLKKGTRVQSTRLTVTAMKGGSANRWSR